MNRLDEVVIFNPLDLAALKRIVKIQLARLTDKISARGISIDITPDAEEALAKEGHDPHYGARPLRRLIQTKILNPLASKMIAHQIKSGDQVKIGFSKGNFTIETQKELRKPKPKAKKMQLAV